MIENTIDLFQHLIYRFAHLLPSPVALWQYLAACTRSPVIGATVSRNTYATTLSLTAYCAVACLFSLQLYVSFHSVFINNDVVNLHVTIFTLTSRLHCARSPVRDLGTNGVRGVCVPFGCGYFACFRATAGSMRIVFSILHP